MAKIVTQASTAISSSIVYIHRKNGTVIETSNVLAAVEPIENYKVEGQVISNGKIFIISKDIDGNFLKLESKMNDIITYGGEDWYVLPTSPSQVDLKIVCSQQAFTLTTKKVKFG